MSEAQAAVPPWSSRILRWVVVLAANTAIHYLRDRQKCHWFGIDVCMVLPTDVADVLTALLNIGQPLLSAYGLGAIAHARVQFGKSATPPPPIETPAKTVQRLTRDAAKTTP